MISQNIQNNHSNNLAQTQQVPNATHSTQAWSDFSMTGYNEFKKRTWASLKTENPELEFKDCNSLIAEKWQKLKEENNITRKPSVKKRRHDEASLDGSLIGLANFNRPPSSLGGKSVGGKSMPRSSKSIAGFSKQKPFCDLCRKDFSSMHNYNTHMKSKPHLKMVQLSQNPLNLMKSQNVIQNNGLQQNNNSLQNFMPINSAHNYDMVLSPTMSAAMKGLHVDSISRRGSSIHPSVTTSGIHHSNQIYPKTENMFTPISVITSNNENKDEMSSGTKESDRKFQLSDNYKKFR